MQELAIKQKLTNYYYFVILNSILACLICTIYWFTKPIKCCTPIPNPTDWISVYYIVTTNFIIFAILVTIIGLIILPIICLSDKKKIIIQTIFSFGLLAFLYLDIRIFQGTFVHVIHLDKKVAINFLIDSNLVFSSNKIIAYIGACIFLIVIYKTNTWINNTSWFKNNNIGVKFIILIVIFAISSSVIYFTANTERKQQLLACTQYLPLCTSKNEVSNKIYSTYEAIKSAKLQYPLQPLQNTAVTSPPNILIIAIDAWRADCFNEQDSPNLWRFSQTCHQIFTNHKSSSNATYGGLFGLFYGIPVSYFNLFQKQPSLLFTRLKQLDYQINCFSTNEQDTCLKQFSNINTLYTLKCNITRQYKKDEELTKDCINWHDKLQKNKPWFAFIFYDSLHGPDFPEDYSNTAQSAIELRNYKEFANKVGKQGFIDSYKTNVHYIDSLANKILTKLKNSNEIDNTIIIITADHGLEWDDNNQGQWGYGSNFTNCQINVPFAIILPKKFQQKLATQQNNLTSHYDLVPTLMQNFLGVTSDIKDYSIGNNLLNNYAEIQQNWMLATARAAYGSYINAIIEKDNTVKIYPSGMQHLIDNFNKLIFTHNINTKHLDQALKYMTRFLK